MLQLTPPNDGPVVVTLYGDAGTGKTTLAATFPKPVFIRVEDGLRSIPASKRPDAFPVVDSPDDILLQIRQLIDNDHAYQTLVIDSVTAAETMFIKKVLDSDTRKPMGINQALGGFGNGQAAVAAMHMQLRRACEVLKREKGMNIVFIGHATVETISPPDLDPYTHYTLNLDKRGLKPYNDNVDLVGFLHLQTIKRGGTDSKQAISTGTILLTCHKQASSISKNRFGIEEDLELVKGENPLLTYLF
jgi:hypothetical protein